MEIIIAVMFSVVFYSRIVYTMYIKSSTGGGMIMPNIKPISDLRNYTDVLHDVTIGSPVFLTKMAAGVMPSWICRIMKRLWQLLSL